QVKSEPHAVPAALAVLLRDALEIEERFGSVGRNRGARILDLDLDALLVERGLEAHATLRGREADGVSKQVKNRLAELRGIEMLVRDRRIEIRVDGDPARFGHRLREVDRGAGDL